ncbi:MAG: CBS domain-containing protein [Oleiphilaceae bacterium]|nr:CBS domain-containing protein [Oleiphilaceae bacterium]
MSITPTDTLVARDIMTPHVKTVPHNWTMHKFAAFLADNDISGSPVSNKDGEVIGIATLKDIADFHFNSVSKDYEAMMNDEELKEARRLRMMIFEGMAKLPVEVGDIMTPIIFSVTENSPIKEVAKLMMQEHLHRIFVKKEEKITGIITTYDLLKVIVDELA